MRAPVQLGTVDVELVGLVAGRRLSMLTSEVKKEVG